MGADIPSLCTFLEIISGNGLEYDSDDINYYAPPRMCYYINDEVPTDEAPNVAELPEITHLCRRSSSTRH